MGAHLRGRSWRGFAAPVATLALAVVITGCGGSTPKPLPSNSGFDQKGERNSQLTAALGACFIKHGLIPQRDLQNIPKKNGQVDTTSPEFLTGFSVMGSSIMYQGKSMSDWVDQGATNGTWPTSLCGPIPAPSHAP